MVNLRKIFGRILSSHSVARKFAIKLDNWLRGSRVLVCGKTNTVILSNVRLVQTRILVEGEKNVLEILPGTRLFDCCISIRGSGHHVTVGRNCVFDRLLLTVASRDTKVVIGEGTEAAPVRMDVVEPDVLLSIGRNCMISRGVEILCTDSHSIMDAASGRRLNPPRSVVIGEHVWLGAHSIVLKGASIGSQSVVGLRSTVSSKIPESVIAVGSPPCVIRTGVTWSRDLI